MDTTKKLTKKEAINKLVGLDVAKWGESERKGVVEMHRGKSKAEAMYAIAYHSSVDDADGALEAAAKAATTSAGTRRACARNDIEFDDAA